MFEHTRAYSGFSVDDVPRARRFYGETLGLRVSEAHGMLMLHIEGGRDPLGRFTTSLDGASDAVMEKFLSGNMRRLLRT